MSSGFVSEAEIAEKRRVRQEEWERVRQPDQPTEAPEAPYDSRSLFDRLEEQKQKKQQEYEEAHKLKNMIKGLDDDEIQFLDFVDRKKMEAEQFKEREEEKELQDFRKKVEELKSQSLDQRIQTEIRTTKPNNVVNSVPKSQHQLLKGVVVKRKSSDIQVGNNAKVAKPSPQDDLVNGKDEKKNSVNDNLQNSDKKRKREDEEPKEITPVGLTCVGILPSLCNYAESSDDSDQSCTSSSDVENEGTMYDLVGRKILPKAKEKK